MYRLRHAALLLASCRVWQDWTTDGRNRHQNKIKTPAFPAGSFLQISWLLALRLRCAFRRSLYRFHVVVDHVLQLFAGLPDGNLFGRHFDAVAGLWVAA